MNEMKNLKVQGFVLLDVDVVALNNAGSENSSNYENSIKTKSIYKNGKEYVYVSGPAWKYWWRESLLQNFGWKMSPITRDSKICYTAADPIEYDDDDIFGYMRAPKGNSKDKKNKTEGKNEGTQNVTRIGPLRDSVLVSVASVHPAKNISNMSRQDGDPIIYYHQEYSAILKGMFSLDINMVGTFSDYNKSGYKNLSESLKNKAIKDAKATEIEDPFGSGKLIRLPIETRIKRATDTISALKYISGGAMQTSNMGDVTPKFIILATTKTGNHPFSHIAVSTGERDEKVILNIKGIKEVLEDYKDSFIGKIFIGRRSGFFEEYDKELKELADAENIEYLTVNKAIDEYVNQLKEQMK